MHNLPVGFGASNSTINFYIANRPQLDTYPTLDSLHALLPGEVTHIAKNTSNHWRKIFNVYAKFLHDWHSASARVNLAKTWQEYRDTELFQHHSQEALLFSAPDFPMEKTKKGEDENKKTGDKSDKSIHIIAGKTYATTLRLPTLQWLDSHFAVNHAYRLIVSPYPDYRQLSNQRIAQLVELVKQIY